MNVGRTKSHGIIAYGHQKCPGGSSQVLEKTVSFHPAAEREKTPMLEELSF